MAAPWGARFSWNAPMSATAERLNQDLRLLDLLQAHPELKEPQGVALRERLTTLCEDQGEEVHPARIAATVVDYLKEAPAAPQVSSQPAALVPWKRPATKQEWEAARATIHAGHEAERQLENKRAAWAFAAVAIGAIPGMVLKMVGLDVSVIGAIAIPVLVSGFGYLAFIMKHLGPAQRALMQKRNATIQQWAIEQTEGRQPLTAPNWTRGYPGWELRNGEVNVSGMRLYPQSPRALNALRAIHHSDVPLLAADHAHIVRLFDEDKAARQKIEDDATRKEWAALMAQPPSDLMAGSDHG